MEQKLFGSFLTEKMLDIFPNFETFKERYKELPAVMQKSGLTDENLELHYYLLVGTYGNSTISSVDLEQWIMQFFITIFKWGPVYQKRLEVCRAVQQQDLTTLTDGASAIYNHAYNPGEGGYDANKPTELTYINEQNTSKYKKDQIKAYAEYMELLVADPTEDYLKKFKPLFLSIVEPYNEVIYYGE